MCSKRTVFVITALMLVCVAAQSADLVGPRLEGTVTLRNGESYTGVILTAWLGIVPGAEIGSTLQDGGYITITVGDAERSVQATDMASLQAEWVQAGTPDDPKWKIAKLTIVTKDGESIVGSPSWSLHATSVIIEVADGSQKKIYAYPMAGRDFSPDNFLAKIVLGEAAAPTETAPPTTEERTVGPVTTEEPPTTEPTTTEPTTEEPPTTTTIEPLTTAEPPAVTPIAPPVVDAIGEGVVLAGEPAIITFVITCPHTGEPVKVRFLIVPLPATE